MNKSLLTYSPNKKAKFNSWFTNYSRYHILNTIKKMNELGRFIPTENLEIDLLNNTHNKFHFDNREEIKDHVFKILESASDERVMKIFELRFYGNKEDRKWKNISRELNLSTQQTTNIYKKYRNLLNTKLKEENK